MRQVYSGQRMNDMETMDLKGLPTHKSDACQSSQTRRSNIGKRAKPARKTKVWSRNWHSLHLFASLCISLHMPAGLMYPNPAWAHWIPLIYTCIYIYIQKKSHGKGGEFLGYDSWGDGPSNPGCLVRRSWTTSWSGTDGIHRTRVRGSMRSIAHVRKLASFTYNSTQTEYIQLYYIYESVIIYVYCNFHMLRTHLHLGFSFGQCFHHSTVFSMTHIRSTTLFCQISVISALRCWRKLPLPVHGPSSWARGPERCAPEAGIRWKMNNV